MFEHDLNILEKQRLLSQEIKFKKYVEYNNTTQNNKSKHKNDLC